MSGLRRSLVLIMCAAVQMADARASDETAVARWDFGPEQSTPLELHGGVQRDVPGPRPPIYPDFSADNTAVTLDGNGAYLAVADTGAQSEFDFTTGDAIALEAWVQLGEIPTGANVYVVGKGRTHRAGLPRDNQNWALRLRGGRGKAAVSFLFATQPQGDQPTSSHWHRWTSTNGFTPGKGWHHIAISYRFGEPETMRGWIDGQPAEGAWDMGGATADPPVVDDDAVWIGSSCGGATGNSFRGSLDAIAVHRRLFADDEMRARYRRVGEEPVARPAPEVMPDLGELPAGKVLFTLHGGMPTHERWLNDDETMPAEARRWTGDWFLLDRLPQKYDDWGIRDRWKPPVLVRMAADVALRPGQHRFLMRVRGLGRLWVNGHVIARSEPLTGSPNGEEPITPVAAPPLPGLRGAEHRQQELADEAQVGPEGMCRVVMEFMVGGKAFRADPGETCLALQTDDGTSYILLGGSSDSSSIVQLTDVDFAAALQQIEAQLRAHDDQVRRTAAHRQDDYWSSRHEAARRWADQNPAPPVPPGDAHPIDAFLQAKIERARAASTGAPAVHADLYERQIRPLLREHCFRCHGEKQQGNLLLTSRDALLRGGDSGLPAIVPGDAAASELMRRVRAEDPGERMPPGDAGLPAEAIQLLETWIDSGATWSTRSLADTLAPTPVVSDTAFLRRVYLDTVGVPPTPQQVRAFLDDPSPDKRQRVIDSLLADQRWADHWTSYWQDVLAENPTLINTSLNTTGPFRWFLYESLLDDKPLDRFVSELILMRGDPHAGGSAGFGIAGENDAPLAAKSQILASAFLGIELQCARCHDSPYHRTTQRELYALAAMLGRKSLTVPVTSRVPAAFFEQRQREPLIQVTLAPDEAVVPHWPFAQVTGSHWDDSLAPLAQQPQDSREQLAVLITAPQNTRFAQVLVNRVWRRLLGAGIVEPPDDWEGRRASHPELLAWLAHQFVTHDYDVKHIVRLIMNSQVYQRAAEGNNAQAEAELRFFTAPERRRMSAEQIVDSLYAAAGRAMDVEELTFDPDGRRPASNRLTLGTPRRAWMFASLANERDRPSLSLPRARAVADVLVAFGWSGSRQSPRTDRETSPNVLQPGVLANSLASLWLSRAVQDSGLARAAIEARSPEQLVDDIFLRYLSRMPSAEERQPLAAALAPGFADRVVPAQEIAATVPLEPLPRVTWSNHLRPEANSIALEVERRARGGPPADPRLRAEWREVYEDVVWSVMNLREFVWIP